MKNDLQQLESYNQKLNQINRDATLSDIGKHSARQAIKEQRENFRTAAYQEAERRYTDAKNKLSRLAERKAEAQNKAAEGWDFERLNYMARAVESTVRQSATIEEVKAVYQSIIEGGDKHARRAWAENVTSEVMKKYPNAKIGTNDIKRVALAEVDKLTQSPDIIALEKQEAEATAAAIETIKQIEQVARHYSEADIFGAGNEFYKLIANARIDEKIDVETLGVAQSLAIA